MSVIYVDCILGNDNWDGTKYKPVRTIGEAMSRPLRVGDYVEIEPGIYKETVKVWKKGVVVWCRVPNTARIDARGLGDIPLQVGAPDVLIWGLDIIGDPDFAGIVVSETYGVIVQRCTVRGAGGSGIYVRKSDNVHVVDNEIYQCSGYSAGSGISIHKPVLQGTTGSNPYHFTIRGNKVHHNKMVTTLVKHTDGNGIILDEFYWFPFGALVDQNTIWENGGDGILVFRSEKASHLIRDNISWGNGTDLEGSGLYGAELGTRFSDNITWLRNIAVARQPRHNAVGNVSDAGKVNKGIVYSGNTLFNEGSGSRLLRIGTGNTAPGVGNELGVDPDFVNPPTDFNRKR